MTQDSQPAASHSFFGRHSVLAYFLLTYLISWTGAFLVAAPHLLRHEVIPQFSGLIMFPVMLLGPAFSGIFLTRLFLGKPGLQNLYSRMRKLRFPAGWYATLLIPPFLILLVLFFLKTFVSPIYAPNRFLIGFMFGLLAAFLEEIGWMGYAFPRMSRPGNALGPAILLGLFWGLWHLPAVNFLGTATPHGAYWFRYFLAFAAAMTAIRVLISWIYVNTGSVALAQLFHASSTGFLVVLSPPQVSRVQEVYWYLVYAATLWIFVALIVALFGKSLRRSSTR
jgi:CAAX protease family protein